MLLYTMDADTSTGNVPDEPTIPGSAFIQSNSESMSPCAAPALSSTEIIEHQSHSFRQQLQDKMSSEKGTEVAYSRHLKRYEEFWIQDQIRRQNEAQAKGETWAIINPHPITATKVCLFLEFESTRNKVRRIRGFGESRLTSE